MDLDIVARNRFPASDLRIRFEFSLCLSRACLGKMIHFLCKNGAKMAFLYLRIRRVEILLGLAVLVVLNQIIHGHADVFAPNHRRL